MPASCVFCGVETAPSEIAICAGCAADLPWNDNACSRCAEPQQTPLVNGVVCAGCQASPPPYEAAFAAFRYAYPIDAAIKLFKFRRRLEYASAFAAVMAGAISGLPPDVDSLVPVPLHWRRQALRGFNQAAELCGVLRKQHKLPIITAMRRLRATPPQSGLDALARRRNLRGAFAATTTLVERHPVIVDDVITTGATSRELARELLRSGAERVSVLALARR